MQSRKIKQQFKKNQSTHPKNSRKIYVGRLDPNINVKYNKYQYDSLFARNMFRRNVKQFN